MDIAAQDLAGDESGGDELDGQEHGRLHMVDFKLLNGLSLFPQFMEQLLLLTHKCSVGLSAGFARSRMIWFSHLRIGPPVSYARRFNTVIRFGQEYDAILFGERDLLTTIAGSNAELFASEGAKVAVTGRARAAIRRATRDASRRQYSELGRRLLASRFAPSPVPRSATGRTSPAGWDIRSARSTGTCSRRAPASKPSATKCAATSRSATSPATTCR